MRPYTSLVAYRFPTLAPVSVHTNTVIAVCVCIEFEKRRAHHHKHLPHTTFVTYHWQLCSQPGNAVMSRFKGFSYSPLNCRFGLPVDSDFHLCRKLVLCCWFGPGL